MVSVLGPELACWEAPSCLALLWGCQALDKPPSAMDPIAGRRCMWLS